jgi:hypothetical protein
MKPEIRTLRILLVVVVLFEMISCAGAFMSCDVPPAPDPFEQQYEEFETLCRRLCSPYPSHIIGRPMPGRLSSDTKCLCASNPPRIAAKWGY